MKRLLLMGTGGSTDGREIFYNVSVLRLDSSDDYLLFMSYTMFDTLDSLLNNTHLYYNHASNKWSPLHLYPFSKLSVKNIRDIFSSDLMLLRPNEPVSPFIYEQYVEVFI